MRPDSPSLVYVDSLQSSLTRTTVTLLLLSLISGRNPDFLIGQHVVAAPRLRASGLQLLPTGYMLVDSGRQTTASYMSGTTPLPTTSPALPPAPPWPASSWV